VTIEELSAAAKAASRVLATLPRERKDEALVLVAADLSGRAALQYAMQIPTQKVGTFDTELVEEVSASFCKEARISVRFDQISGS